MKEGLSKAGRRVFLLFVRLCSRRRANQSSWMVLHCCLQAYLRKVRPFARRGGLFFSVRAISPFLSTSTPHPAPCAIFI